MTKIDNDPALTIDGVDLTGRYVLLRAEAMSPEYRGIEYRVFLAGGGFGCSPTASGRAVFGEHPADGEQVRWNRGHVARLATASEVRAALAMRPADLDAMPEPTDA